MFEGLVTTLLNRVLGMYVHNFDPKQLQIGIWNGQVNLKNLELRKEALDQLKLPLNVVEGHVGNITLSIPLSNLRGAPVKVNVQDVFILAAPREEADFNPEEEERRAHTLKMEKLDSAELLKERNTEGMSKEEQQKQQSFAASLTTAIIDNLQVTVQNIHIRYEDSISDPGHPFAAGLTLKELSAQSTDENWKPKWIAATSGSTHKLAKLGSLAVYWDTDSELMGSGKASEDESNPSRDEMLQKFQDMALQEDNEAVKKHQYILKPISGQAGLEMDKTGKIDRPKIKARVFFDELGFMLDEDQYRDALMLVDLFHYFIRHQEYKKLQPKASPKEDPRAWLQFAAKAVLDRVHEKNWRWNWEYFAERRDDRKRYIELFKKKKKNETLSPPEASDLDKLEHKLSYEDLRFWRSLARNQLRKENVGVKQAPQKQTWGQWMFGTGKQESSETQLSEKEREELYAAIDFDEKKAIAEAVDLPKETVKLQLGVHLQTGSFTLKRDPHGKAVEPLKLLFENLSLGFIQRPESMLTNLTLQGIRLYDGTTDGSLYPEIITVKNAPSEPSVNRITELTDDDSIQQAMQLADDAAESRSQDPLLTLMFEKNPLDGHADSVVDVKLLSMEIIYNPQFIMEVSKFFKPPERHMESIGALMDQAGEAVEGIRKQTRAGLEFALEEHKTIDVNLDLQAPLIIVPDSVTERSSICLILDAGHVSMKSELVEKDKLHEIQAKQSQTYSDDDYKKLEGLLYDKFLLKLDDTQVLIGPSVEATRAQLNEKVGSKNYHIIQRINMDFLIETCIVPKGSELTKLRITGKLPVLHASLSDAKYKNLMRLLEVAIPKSDSPAEQKPAEDTKQLKITRTRSSNATKTLNTLVGRQRSRSFQFSAQEHELVMEEHDDDDADGDDQFKDARSGDPAPGTSLNQRNFEFNFVVERLQGSLYRSDPSGKEQDHLLAELLAHGFSLSFYQRQYDMAAEVSLKTLALEDHVEESPLPEFKNIISSEDASDQKDLFQLKFVKVNPSSPEFMPVYEGIATNLDVSVSTINLVVTRKTLLTLLDFVLVTFASGDSNGDNKKEQPKLEVPEDDTAVEEVKEQKPNADRIRIKAELKTISMILNNDGIRLATLSLNTASVGLTLMGKTMRLGARIGNMSLVDDVNQGASEASSLRQLLTIEGDQLADFSYETFDEASDAYPGHDSAIKLRSGSIKINFVTEPFRKIMDFGVKFGKMQAIFNAARQAAANQAEQISERATRMHFDILIKTPIVVFPRLVVGDKPARDLLTANLGEIYANNKFVPVDDTENAPMANELTAGIRNIRLTSLLHYKEGKSEELDLIDKVDLGFDVTYVEHRPGLKRPDMEVRGKLSDINLRLSSQQMRLVVGLAQSIPAAFATDPDEAVEKQVENEIPKATMDSAKAANDNTLSKIGALTPSHLGPELGSDPERWTKIDLVFRAGTVGLELLQSQDDQPVGPTQKAGLSKFSLNKTHVKLRMLNDGALESELLVQSFTIQDTRQKETNKYRDIMSLINSDVSQQFMANVTMSGGDEKNLLAILTVDSPRIILSLDYLFAIQHFVSAGLISDEPSDVVQQAESEDALSVSEMSQNMTADGEPESPTTPPKSETKTDEQPSMTLAFRINIVDAQMILLANPAITASEAIVLSMKQAILAKQHATTIQVEKVGMFLCRMDRFDSSRLRILDDFSIATSLDVRSQMENSSMTNIQVDIEPMVLRLSLRDILLAMQIVSKASSMSGGDQSKSDANGDSKPDRIKQIEGSTKRSRRTSTRRTSTYAAKSAHSIKTHKTTSMKMAATDTAELGSAVLKHEEMNLHMGGIRVVLIGDLHELPMLDWSVKEFGVEVRDWSAQLTTEMSIDTFINVYNFSKSAWEPLIEPWTLGLHMSREQNPGKLAVDLYSMKPMELTLTSATIALFSKSAQFLSTDEDVLSKPRKADAPYRIRNYTGFTLDVWAQDHDGKEGNAKKLQDGAEEEWRFEDPKTVRETLAPEGSSGVVGIKLEDSGFDSIDRVAVNREGEKIYSLQPRKEKVLHRLLVEVSLGTDNVKYITFRSPLVLENNTQIPIEMGVFNPAEGELLKVEKIAPGQSRPAPVGAAFYHSVVVRPDQGFGYEWSNERLFWKDLLKQQTRTITCVGEDQEEAPPFYFQMHAVVNKSDPLSMVYPYMKIRLTAPVEIQNLLPYDFNYKIYDKNTKKDWSNFLRRGGISPGHVVNLNHLLLLSIDIEDTPFEESDYAIINSPDRDFSREKSVVVKDKKDLPLGLKLHYFNIPDSGGAFKVTVYCPYVILNRTGMALDLRSKSTFSAVRAAAGTGVVHADADGDGQTRAKPLMFSFPSDDQKNRAIIKLGESAWSKPQSFNAIGSEYSVQIPAANGRTEMPIGVHVSQGEGKYNLTNVVTIAPRFVIKSRLTEDIFIREPGSSDTTTLKPGDLHAVKFLRQTADQQLSLCWPGLNNKWSSPFYISNVGRVHVKLAKEKQKQQLLKIEILMEEGTIFVNISVSQHWPFTIRNESDTEFMFYQANPNVEEDEEDRNSSWRPIRYRLPPRSIMPYAWDYPASRNKDLVLDVQNRRRSVKLAEIGQQIPLRLTSADGSQQKTVDIDVVADGPKQTLVLSNWKPQLSLYRQKTNASKSTTGFEVKDQDTDVTFSAHIRLAGVGISLINRNLKELLYCTFRDIELKYNESALYQMINWTTKWIQIDNQLYGGIFPILLYPSVVPKTGKEMEAHPIFHTAITRVKDDSYGVLYIKYFTVLLQQMTFEIDEDFIFALIDFSKIPGASWNRAEDYEGKLCDEEIDIPEPQRQEQGQDVYFELLHLQPMQIDLSFVRTERINAEDTMSSNNPLMFAVNVLTMSLGNVNDAPLRYNALMLENARISPNALITNMQNHYVQESLRQVHIVLGSADFLGNPVGLFNNVSSGVADIFYEPYQGLVMSDRPQDLGLGIAKGASSFVKKSVFGFSDSMAKFTGSISKGLAAASMDKEFQDARRMSRARNRPKHALYGITAGGNAFADSLASGIGGLARHPLEGAEKEGFGGFMKGVGKGVIGLATKPAIGAFDLASNLAEGVRNTTTVFDQDGLDRVRLTRFIGQDGILRPYSQRESLGQFWLKTLDNGRYFNEDYIAHLELQGKEMLVMLTYNSIMLVRTKKLTTEWNVPLKDIQRISKERTGMNITLKEGRTGPFIPIQDESSRNWLYRQIAVAVNSYNEKWQAKG